MVDITKAIESHKKWLSGDECGDLANHCAESRLTAAG